MHRLGYWVIALSGLILLNGCKELDKPEPFPAFLGIQNPQVELDSVTGFSSSTGIRNVWIYYSGLLNSIVRVRPDSSVVIPILNTGRSDFSIDGGIFETGQSAFNVPYPFWQPLNFTSALQASDTLWIQPKFKYIAPTFFDFIVKEDFEGGSMDLVPFASGLAGDSTFMRLRNNNNVFQGNGMGYVHFGTGDVFFEAISANPFRLVRGRDCYLEITYQNSIPFQAGLLYQGSAGLGVYEILTVSPSSDWNTIYINLIGHVRQIINSGGEDTNFWIWLKADGADADGYIQMDDIRLLQMKN